MTSDSFKDSTVILDSNLDLLSTISQPNATTATTNQALQQPPPQPQPQRCINPILNHRQLHIYLQLPQN